MSAPSNLPLEARVVRRFSHSLERVYKAWTEPSQIGQWWYPMEEITLKVSKFEIIEGGYFLFEYSWPGGDFPVKGKFYTVQPNECLIFSWLPQEPDVDAGKETLVSVWFRCISAELTEVELRHTLFPDSTCCERHLTGWQGTFLQLENFLTSDKS